MFVPPEVMDKSFELIVYCTDSRKELLVPLLDQPVWRSGGPLDVWSVTVEQNTELCLPCVPLQLPPPTVFLERCDIKAKSTLLCCRASEQFVCTPLAWHLQLVSLLVAHISLALHAFVSPTTFLSPLPPLSSHSAAYK